MNVTVEGENIRINLIDLVKEHIPDDLLPTLALELSLHDTIIEHVADQILDGFTECGACGATIHSINGAGDSMSPLQEARRRVALMADAVAAEEIKRLSANLRKADKEIQELNNLIRYGCRQEDPEQQPPYIYTVTKEGNQRLL